LCSIIAIKTIISTSVFEVADAAPSAIPSALIKNIFSQKYFYKKYLNNQMILYFTSRMNN
jgi:hypothetical protein